MRASTGIALLLAALLGGALVTARPYTVEDAVRLARLGDPLLQPNGEFFVYTMTTYAEGSDAGTTDLMIANIRDGGNASPICPQSCSGKGSPEWFADGSGLLFTCGDENGVSQVWHWKVDSEDCQKISDFPLSVDNLRLSPDMTKLVFSTEVYVGMTMAETKAKNDEVDSRAAKYTLYKDPYIRHWDAWHTPDRFVHIWVADLILSGEDYSLKNERDLMPTFDGDCPIRPFGDRGQFSISPDSEKVAFVSQKGKEVAWNTDDMLYVAPLKKVEDPECLTCDDTYYPYTKARANGPVWGPGSDILYFRGMQEPASESDRVRVVKVILEGKQFDYLTENFDRTIDSIVLDPLDPTECGMYALVNDEARERIYYIDGCKHNEPIKLTQTGSYSGINIVTTGENKGKILAAHSSYCHPSEIYLGQAPESTSESSDSEKIYTWEQLTTHNDDLLSELSFVKMKEFFIKKDGETVQSWYFLPYGWVKGDPLPPLIVYVHGGPESPWGDSWSYRWNPQIFATMGYSMVLTNFHGSDGWGDAFTKSVRQNWFGTPFDDVVDGYNWMIDHGFGDPNHVAAMGASFGGTFMNWLNGHNTIGARVIVSHDGVFDVRHSGSDTEELYFPETEIGGPVYNPTYRPHYDDWNPAMFVHQWKTPMLVIHGGYDFRIPYTHGISAFQALRHQGIDSNLLYFPTQSHWCWAPQESVYWHHTVLDWIAKYI